jgi:integrase
MNQKSQPKGNPRDSLKRHPALSDWLGSLDVVPEGVQPNHGWRHRFKTLGRELGYSDRVVDAICGHAGRTAGDNYGDVTLEA